MKKILVIFILLTTLSTRAQVPQQKIQAGAERIPVYLPLLKGHTVGIFANQTSMVGNTHLVDTLRKLGIDIKVIFGPEHGIRGTAKAVFRHTGGFSFWQQTKTHCGGCKGRRSSFV